MIPALAVQQNGLGVVNNDNMNTWVQGGCLLANLQQFVGLTLMTVYLVGLAAPGDGGQGMFYWNATWTGTPDNVNSIQPFAVTVGAWLRLPNATGVGTIAARYATAGGTDTMVLGDSVISWNYAFSGTKRQILLSAVNVQNNYQITIKDRFGDSAINNISISPQSGTIDGKTAPAILNIGYMSLTFAAYPSTNDWVTI